MVLEVSYGLGVAAFLILIALSLLKQYPKGMGLVAIAAFTITAIWAFCAAAQVSWGVTNLLESLRSWAWLQFIAFVLLKAEKRENRAAAASYQLAIPVFGALAVANETRFLFETVSPVDFSRSQMFERVVLAIIGLLLVENLVRNTHPTRRWHIFPLCLAAGSLFAYDLFVFAEALVTRSVDITLLSVRGIVLVLIVPLLILTMVRNEDWRIDMHVSRRVVFHTATLTAGGIFLLAAGAAASLLGQLPGDWGGLLKVTFFFGSVLVLATVISTENMRSRLWRLISENFFSHRYDYREEWLRFVETLSSVDDLDPLQIRVIRAVSNIVDSPAGALWLRDGNVYRLVNSLNITLREAEAEPVNGPFIALFNGGDSVLELASLALQGPPLPRWAGAGPPVWLAVPLVQRSEIMGFIVLAPPRAPLLLNWESYDLLRTVGRQVASYLQEERATRALVDAGSLIEYNKKFAFIVHDVKNLSSQLGMMVSNIRRYSEHPDFRTDMVRTLENSVGRLNGLLNKLRSQGEIISPRQSIDPVPVVKSIIADFADGKVCCDSKLEEGIIRVTIDPQELHSVLTHLVTNAVEASPAGEAVKVRFRTRDVRVVIDVEDKGSGMDAAFIRNELFTPLRSTKSHGHGIGAFQAREIVRASGGELEVVSAPGQGTIMRIFLPVTRDSAAAGGTVLSQNVAPA